MEYKQTPSQIMEILELFNQHQLSYLLFKCEHIFAGENKNLDILFEKEEHYNQAAKILQQQGFVLRLSEKIEKYKQMFTRYKDEKISSIHLHRQVAWHGLVALDKAPLFAHRKIVNPLIVIPSQEDSLLIHAAHILFENFKRSSKEEAVFQAAPAEQLDWKYIHQQTKKYHWKAGFRRVLTNARPLTFLEISQFWTTKMIHEPSFYYLKKMLLALRHKLLPPQKSMLLALIGVNGTGKSTLSKKTLQEYLPITSHLGYKQAYYYFGWSPRFLLTKLMSKRNQQKNKALFQETVLQQKVKIFDLKQELLFCYIFLEYYYRYRVDIKPKLKQGYLIITDRYFYDIFGQYPYSRRSIILPFLLKLFPAPTKTFLLQARITEIQKRKKTEKNKEEVSTTERTMLPESYLLQQEKNYQLLAAKMPLCTLDTEQDFDKNIASIIERTWRMLL